MPAPLTRQLSSNSLDAFDDFCHENPPLSRRLSHSDTASIGSTSKRRHDGMKGRGQEILKKRRSTMSSRSLVPNKSLDSRKRPPKARKTKGTPVKSGKANDENMIQSPTPYWKVAKERGDIHSPPETRSNKKRRTGRVLELGRKASSTSKRDGIMVFSPPNQVANAKREKEENEQKTKEW